MAFKKEDLRPVAPGLEPMSLNTALWILSELHTRDDDLVGYSVHASASPDYFASRWSQADYIRAWGIVREAAKTGFGNDIRSSSDFLPVSEEVVKSRTE